MAYTLHWSNTTHFNDSKMHRDEKGTQTGYARDIGSISSVISIQEDVIFPNALGSLSNPSKIQDEVFALGCKGHQIDKEFNLEPVVPFVLPLVQYPTKTRGLKLDEIDMCARPVLNWEKYIQIFYHTTKKYRTAWKRLCRMNIAGSIKIPKLKEEKIPLREARQKEKTLRRLKERELLIKKLNKNVPTQKSNPNKCDSKSSDSDEEEVNEDLNKSTDDSTDFSDIDVGNSDESEGEETKPNKSSREKTKVSELEWEETSKSDIELTEYSKNLILQEIKSEGRNIRSLKKELFTVKPKFGKEDNLNNDDLQVIDPNRGKKEKEFYIKSWRRKQLPIPSLRRYKNEPELKIQGTWNNLYGGSSGACDWIYDKTKAEQIQVLVGCGSKLRVVNLEKSNKKSLISYGVEGVWEEEKSSVPTNVRPGKELEPHDDLIFQIKGYKRLGRAAIRRGKSVEIYDFLETPSLISSIPNICYGTEEYNGKLNHGKDPNLSPLLTAMDINPIYQTELLTLDQNLVIRYVDMVKECTIGMEQGRIHEVRYRRAQKYPNFDQINDFSGVTYAYNGNNSFYWQDSMVYFIDRRTPCPDMGIYNWITLFDLRRDLSSLSWSDQAYFNRTGLMSLNEMMSCVQPSTNSMYYYVGTTSRLFLMDLRVPKNPVIKMSHGMKTPATYINSFENENFEVVVGGSQKTNEVFCATLDKTHIACIERPDCKARNPILSSYPKHLSNSIDFFNQVSDDGFTFGFEADHLKAKDHCHAWTTGISLFNLKNDERFNEPPNFALFASNNFGDLFYQEWQQKSDPVKEKIEFGDERLRSALDKWKSSFMYNPIDNLQNSSNRFAPVDCSIIIEPTASTFRLDVEKKEITEFKWKVDPIVFSRIQQHQMPLEEQINQISKFKGAKVKKLLQVWENPYANYEIHEDIEIHDSSSDEFESESAHQEMEDELNQYDEDDKEHEVEIKIEIQSGDEEEGAQDPLTNFEYIENEVEEENDFHRQSYQHTYDDEGNEREENEGAEDEEEDLIEVNRRYDFDQVLFEIDDDDEDGDRDQMDNIGSYSELQYLLSQTSENPE